MRTICSKKHKYKFYLSIALGAVFFLALGTGMSVIFFKEFSKGPVEDKLYSLLMVSSGMFLMAFFIIYKYYKNAPGICVDEKSIKIGKQTFSWQDLKEIELTGKQNFPFIIHFPMEATAIHFKNGITKLIFDDMYENSSEIKAFLKQVLIDKRPVEDFEILEVYSTEIEFEEFETFKGEQITSLRGISLWGLLGFVVFILFFRDPLAARGGIHIPGVIRGILVLFEFLFNVLF
jgi:hypothetical protein